jgi:hypothetical protein
MITKSDLKAGTVTVSTPAPETSEELPVLATLKSLREGEFIQDLNDRLQEAIDTATELGKPAMITIKVGVTPAGRTVILDDDIKSKLPVAIKDATIFFLDKGNRLTRNDPKQTQFPAEVGFSGAAAVSNG